MKSLFISVGIICITAVTSLGESPNLLSFDNAPLTWKFAESQYKYKNADKEFIPCHKAFIKDGDFRIFRTGSNKDNLLYRYTAFRKIKLTPNSIYNLTLESLGAEKIRLLITVFYYKRGNLTAYNILFQKAYRQNSNGMSFCRKAFAPPLDADEMIVSIGVNDVNHRPITPGSKVMIKSLAITRKENIEQVKNAGQNLLPLTDFMNCSLGPYKSKKYFYPGDPASKTRPPVKAEIVISDGSKCLKIEHRKGMYPYPFFKSLPFKCKNKLIKVEAQVKGRGKLDLGLWFSRKNFLRDYAHRKTYNLTNVWEKINFTRTCLSPQLSGAEIAFTCYQDAVVYIKEIKMTLINYQ